MAEQVHDHVVVGGGIVGLSTALHLLRARPGADVLVLEKEQAVASHQTGHNSGVVHSGIYYTPGSLKARFCREGARLTAEYAVERGIPLHAIGKLLVATDERELAGLRTLRERADVNRVPAEMIDAAELRRREPHVSGLGALWLPGTGITDFGAITRALADDVRRRGGSVVTGCEVNGIVETGNDVTAGDRIRDERHRALAAGHVLRGRPGRPCRTDGRSGRGFRDRAVSRRVLRRGA